MHAPGGLQQCRLALQRLGQAAPSRSRAPHAAAQVCGSASAGCRASRTRCAALCACQTSLQHYRPWKRRFSSSLHPCCAVLSGGVGGNACRLPRCTARHWRHHTQVGAPPRVEGSTDTLRKPSRSPHHPPAPHPACPHPGGPGSRCAAETEPSCRPFGSTARHRACLRVYCTNGTPPGVSGVPWGRGETGGADPSRTPTGLPPLPPPPAPPHLPAPPARLQHR